MRERVGYGRMSSSDFKSTLDNPVEILLSSFDPWGLLMLQFQYKGGNKLALFKLQTTMVSVLIVANRA